MSRKHYTTEEAAKKFLRDLDDEIKAKEFHSDSESEGNLPVLLLSELELESSDNSETEEVISAPRNRAWHRSKRLAEVESSRTSLASRTSSRTHFEVLGLSLEGQVLGLGLEASRRFFFEDRLKNFCEDVFFCFFFGRALALVSLILGLGLEHFCPWPRECLSSERLSLALASDFFCVLGLGHEPCVLDSTSED